MRLVVHHRWRSMSSKVVVVFQFLTVISWYSGFAVIFDRRL